ncbi:hypothetical protein RND81_04G111800 [Saponaria officinalis]|uniref:C3H1-type domain-containing protein n=1 Tax=Saponaria officinalis TaxID=3572 RepID=A0AAW1LE65_SAPOF
MEDSTIPKSTTSSISPSISIENELATLSLSPKTPENNDFVDNCGGAIAFDESEKDRIHDEESVKEDREKEEEIVDCSYNDDDDDDDDGDGIDDGESKKIRFPVRQNAEDCAYYMRTGLCKFGVYCKFNHPPLPKFPQSVKVKGKEDACETASDNVRENDDSVEKGVRFDCKGEKECPYYMRNGSCKFGASCRFNHPDPASVGGFDALSSYSNGGAISSPNASPSTLKSWSPPSALNENPAYLPLMFSPTQRVPLRPEWTAYQAPVYPPRPMHTAPPYVNRQPSERNLYSHQQEHILVDEFPERPGQPECSYFLKTGDCKYKSACKFHHPRNVSKISSPFSLSELGLPLRPGESICSYYSRYGICKYGPSCKYDHPVNYAPSAVDMTPSFGHSMINNHAMAAGI